MSLKSIAIFVAVLGVLFSPVLGESPTPQATPASEARSEGEDLIPVLVELYTSEGCSSCPPADALLGQMLRQQPVPGVQIVALGQHVDYWNRLGWKDPYSSSQSTKRQHAYADYFRNETIYTPQMIVDGREEFIGGNRGRALEAIERAALERKGSISIDVHDAAATTDLALTIRISDVPPPKNGDHADVLLAVTEAGLETLVSRGENAGRMLAHDSVVRDLRVIGGIDTTEPIALPVDVVLSNKWKRENLRLVAFIQERAGRRVLGVATVALGR